MCCSTVMGSVSANSCSGWAVPGAGVSAVPVITQVMVLPSTVASASALSQISSLPTTGAPVRPATYPASAAWSKWPCPIRIASGSRAASSSRPMGA